jgi:hypothetical protein
MAPSTAMTAPATPASPLPARPELTHPCARCGAPVALDVGLCERCNPLGLKDSASSQVHGSVFLAVGLAIAALAVAAHLAVAGIGPFRTEVTGMRAGPTAGSIVATIALTNDGGSAGTATCRVTDPADRGIGDADIVYTPRVEAHGTVTFDHAASFGSVDRPFDVTCTGP